MTFDVSSVGISGRAGAGPECFGAADRADGTDIMALLQAMVDAESPGATAAGADGQESASASDQRAAANDAASPLERNPQRHRAALSPVLDFRALRIAMRSAGLKASSRHDDAPDATPAGDLTIPPGLTAAPVAEAATPRAAAAHSTPDESSAPPEHEHDAEDALNAQLLVALAMQSAVPVPLEWPPAERGTAPEADGLSSEMPSTTRHADESFAPAPAGGDAGPAAIAGQASGTFSSMNGVTADASAAIATNAATPPPDGTTSRLAGENDRDAGLSATAQPANRPPTAPPSGQATSTPASAAASSPSASGSGQASAATPTAQARALFRRLLEQGALEVEPLERETTSSTESATALPADVRQAAAHGERTDAPPAGESARAIDLATTRNEFAEGDRRDGASEAGAGLRDGSRTPDLAADDRTGRSVGPVPADVPGPATVSTLAAGSSPHQLATLSTVPPGDAGVPSPVMAAEEGQAASLPASVPAGASGSAPREALQFSQAAVAPQLTTAGAARAGRERGGSQGDDRRAEMRGAGPIDPRPDPVVPPTPLTDGQQRQPGESADSGLNPPVRHGRLSPAQTAHALQVFAAVEQTAVVDRVAESAAEMPRGPALPNEQAVAATIVQSMRVQYRDGVGTAVVQLDPEYLGPVRIVLEMGSGGSMSAHLHAEDGEVREWMEANVDTLRQGLAEKGLSLERVTVSDVERDDERLSRDPQQKDSSQQHERPRRRAPGRRAGAATFQVIV